MTTQMSRSGGRRRIKRRAGIADQVLSPKARLVILCAFLLVIFMTGGSSRADMTPVVILRPVSILVLGYGMLTLSREHIRAFWPLVTIAGAAVVLTALHLIPLPPAIWHALPGRGVIAEIDGILGLGSLWRPLTLDPQATRNAIMALATPCAVLILAIQLDRGGREFLLTFTLALGMLTAVWALLQVMGSPRGPLYLYELTNYGAPVGLFANRNHQAVFLSSLLPLIYWWAQLGRGSWNDLSSDKGRRSGAGVAGVLLLVPLVLIAGSRAGLLTLVLSLCATLSLAVVASAEQKRRGRLDRSNVRQFLVPAVSIAALAGLAFVTIAVGRDRAFERLIGSDPIVNDRVDLLPTIWAIAAQNLPWGTGIGSFDDVYRMYETDAMLSPNYLNHAHNDFLEVAMTGGVAGIAILAFAMSMLALRASRIFSERRDGIRVNCGAVAALIALIMLLVASLVDYPLRTPAMVSYAVLLAVWAWRAPDTDP